MSDDVDLTARVRILEAELLAVRQALLQAVAVVLALVIAVGSLLPVFRDEIDDEVYTVRGLTGGFTILTGPESALGGESIAIAIGFLGLGACQIGLVAILLLQVVGGEAKPSTGWFRTTLAVLAVIGSVVACLLSLLTLGTDDGSSAGWGGVVMLLGAGGAAVLLTREGPRELWVTRR